MQRLGVNVLGACPGSAPDVNTNSVVLLIKKGEVVCVSDVAVWEESRWIGKSSAARSCKSD